MIQLVTTITIIVNTGKKKKNFTGYLFYVVCLPWLFHLTLIAVQQGDHSHFTNENIRNIK